MAKTSGGVRGNNITVSYMKETEKAVMLQMVIEVEIAPKGGFVSSLVRDRIWFENVWIPKSQLSDTGRPSEWITKQKKDDIITKNLPENAQILRLNSFFRDANQKRISSELTKKEKQWKKEREKESAKRLEAGKKRYNSLVAKARASGVKGRLTGLKSETIIKKMKKNT